MSDAVIQTLIEQEVASTLIAVGVTTTTVVGVQGPPGGTGLPGGPFVPRGPWDGDTEYVENDLVTFGGSSYYTLSTTTGDEPPSGPWTLLAGKGDPGEPGPAGQDSTVPGPPGTAASVAVGDVVTGAPGSEADVENTGTSSAAVLKFTIPRGDKGEQGDTGPASTVPGPPGPDGRSAYEVAVSEGFSGDEAAWLASLVGAAGGDGEDGASAYEVAVEGGFVGSEAEWLESLVGAAGVDGSVWHAGSGAPDGGLGVVGDFYLDSASGDYYVKTGASTWTLAGNLTGPAGGDGNDGAPGLDGRTVLSGSGAPTTEGVDGDFYIDTTAWVVYGPKSGTWGSGTSLVGPPGSNGSPGVDGSPQWTGPWSAGEYTAGQAVSHGGSSYVANTTTSQEPPGSDWDPLALKGADGDPGAATFLALTDAPSTYADQAGKLVAVNEEADGLEFVDAPSGGGIPPADGLVIVVHGDDDGVARPTAGCVLWRGSADPSNAAAGDMWDDSEDWD